MRIEKKHAATEAEKKEVKVKKKENGSEIVKEKLDLSQTWTLDTFWNPGKEDEPGFIDPEFPHTLQSLFEPGLFENSIRFRRWIDTPVEWVRAIYLQGDEKPRLFDRIEPASVCQGAVVCCGTRCSCSTLHQWYFHGSSYLVSLARMLTNMLVLNRIPLSLSASYLKILESSNHPFRFWELCRDCSRTNIWRLPPGM